MSGRFILAPFSGVVFIIFLALFVLKLFAFIDALTRPAPSYVAAGKQTKVFWGVILGIGTFINFSFIALAGVIAAIVYLVDVRPAIREVGRGGQGWYR